MYEHVHTWKTVDGEHAAYKCDGCEALGRRDLRTGKILLAKRPFGIDLDARPKTYGGGHIFRKPDADQQAERM